MKDEICVLPIKGFVGLKSKMYNFITDDNCESEKEKGINKNVAYDELKSEDYQNVLLNRSYRRHEINRIQSKGHNIGSYRIKESIKILCLLTMKKNILMYTVSYYNFI